MFFVLFTFSYILKKKPKVAPVRIPYLAAATRVLFGLAVVDAGLESWTVAALAHRSDVDFIT